MAYDVAVVGAGPIGSLCAIAHAQHGARVALFEGNLKAATRLAGEWLHPPAVQMLREAGVELSRREHSSQGKGFVVTPDDQSEAIVLPYPDKAIGLTYEHAELVAELHQTISEYADIDFFQPAKVRSVEHGRVAFAYGGSNREIETERIIGADGRASIVRRSLDLSPTRFVCSRMIGVLAEGVNVPHQGYGHVILGGPGPILMFQLGDGRVRIIVDIPLDLWSPRNRVGVLTESYAALLPNEIRKAFVSELRNGRFQAANNEIRPRFSYGNSNRVLIGDAAGNYHPLTAVGMTLGFGDAVDLAMSDSFLAFQSRRFEVTRAPELLAMGLYEVFVDHRAESETLRQEVYRIWRVDRAKRDRTMALLACEDTSVTRLALTFFEIVSRAIFTLFPRSWKFVAWRRMRDLVKILISRILYFLRGSHILRKRKLTAEQRHERAHEQLARALLTSMQSIDRKQQSVRTSGSEATIEVEESTCKAVQHLLTLQAPDGSWEGEMVWCPMLSAQYVLLHYVIGKPLDPERIRLLLRNFAHSRSAEGVWGLHDHSQPYLFVTTLVYVAARLLGVARDNELIARAGEFIRTEGVLSIPSWGKFWLAILNLYQWRGLNAVLPELWKLPRWLVIHPSNWYCHTRLIYMAMSVVFASKFQVPESELIAELRDELYPEGFERTDFRKSCMSLRAADLFAPPTRLLRIGYRLARWYERIHIEALRRKCVADILARIRWELKSSSHTSISPVSGSINILALWLHDKDDSDYVQALERLEDWIWEDEERGTRITGARSASWDTGFAMQALAPFQEDELVSDSMKRAADFLHTQQIRESFLGYENAFRNDPKGGWCFAGVWHGWPVSDCTAEATLGILATNPKECDSMALAEAIQFMLRCQNRDGGFGSYEANRSRIDLEWMNPAEMFGESMTEKSYVECTASCVTALAKIHAEYSTLLNSARRNAIDRAADWLRSEQSDDGSWRGVWGVQFIYGTMFGIRGLLASGAKKTDPAIRNACHWLLEKQLPNGGWGEHHSGCYVGRFVQHEESQVIQTAWALIALLEANDSNWEAISQGVKYLVETQHSNGSWPRQDMAGVFFRTALLDYVLYRQYFPLHALGLYEQRRCKRARLSASAGVHEMEALQST